MNPAVISAIVSGFELVKEIRRTLMERGEWTPEQEAAFSGKTEQTFKEPHWTVQDGPKDASSGG